MPYRQINHLPRPVRAAFTPEGQRIYLEVFNCAYEEEFGDELRAAKRAWYEASKAGQHIRQPLTRGAGKKRPPIHLEGPGLKPGERFYL